MAPRTPSKPRQAPRQAPLGNGKPREAVLHDNLHGEEEERVQLISFVSKLSQAEELIEQAKAPLKAAQKARSQIVSLAKAAGFTAKELERRMEEMNNPSRDNPERIARETRHRRWLGIIQPEQTEMQLGDKVPQEAKDEAHWKAEGYKAGLRQKSSTPPTECAERFVQAYMKEHERGLKEVLEANVPGAHRLRAKAEADFKADNPEVDVDAAARKLKNDPAFMARGAAADAGFEATPEELAAQKPRQAIVDRREGATSGEEVV